MGVPNPIFDYIGTGSPVSALANAAPGSMYRQKDGSSGSMIWQKTTSAWEAVGTSSWNQAAADALYVKLVASNTMTADQPLIFNNATQNWLTWASVGVAAPAFTTRSAGTKLVLYPSLTGSAVDYAIGVETSTLWFSTPSSMKWYVNTANIMSLSSTAVSLFGVDLILPSSKRFYFDGGSDSYAFESSPNGVRFVAGGSNALAFIPTGAFIEAGGKFWFDGSSDTYIWESSSNLLDLVAGGTTGFRITSSQNIAFVPYLSSLSAASYALGNKAYVDIASSTGGGNALRWGHSNPDYINTLGTYNSAGYPYISFHSYQTTGDAFLRLGGSTVPMQLRHDSNPGNFSMLWGAAGTTGTTISWNEQFRWNSAGVFEVLASGGGVKSPYFLVTTGTGAGSYVDGSLNTHGTIAITGINSGYAGIRFVSVGYTLMSSGVGGVALGMYSGSSWMFYISDGADIAARTTFWHNRQYMHFACTSSQTSGGIQFTNSALTVKGYAYWDASGVGFLDSGGSWRLTCSTSGVSLIGASSCTSTLSATDFILV